MDDMDEMDRLMIEQCFNEEINDARIKMQTGDGGESTGRGSIWPVEIGGVSCFVNHTWFARMEEIRDGRSLVVGECVVDIVLMKEVTEDILDEDFDEHSDTPSALVDLPFEYVDGGIMGSFDQWWHFEKTFEAAKARLKSMPRYLALREAAELDAGLPEGRSERRGSL